MALSTTRQAIAHISKAIAPRMRALGFRQQANHFHRRSADLVHGINFQASRWGSFDEGFTLNLLVTSDWLYQAWSGRAFPANPATALFPVQQRIGSLMPSHLDHWWSVSTTTDIGALSNEIGEQIAAHALPFFDTFPDSHALLERARSGIGIPGLTAAQVPLVHAIIASHGGLRDEARLRLERAVIDAGDSLFAGTVQSLALRLAFPGT